MIRGAVWIGFGVLCLVSGTYWAIPHEAALPRLEWQALAFGLPGIVALCFSGHSSARGGWLQLAIAGIGFFGLPIAVMEIAGGSVGEITRSAVFAIVPVVVLLVIAAGEATGGARSLLVPALVGLGGLLLLLPLQFSTSVRGQLMLGLIGATVVVVGICSVWLYRMLQGLELARAVAVTGIANAAFLLVCARIRSDLAWNWSELISAASLLSSLAAGFEIVLIVWLLREMPPARFAARYLLIPLVTLFESYLLLHPEPTLRIVSGTVLLTGGTGMLLLLEDVDHDAVLSLR